MTKSKILVIDELETSLAPLKPILDQHYIIFTSNTFEQAQSQLKANDDFSLILLCSPSLTLDLENFLYAMKNDPLYRNFPILALVTEIDPYISLLEKGIYDFIQLPEFPVLILKRMEHCISLYLLKQADIGIRNIMEDVVLNQYNRIKNTLNCCTCKICKSDIITYALNQLTPRYVATHKGELLSKTSQLEPHNEIEIISALAKSAQVINKNPRHH